MGLRKHLCLHHQILGGKLAPARVHDEAVGLLKEEVLPLAEVLLVAVLVIIR